MVVCGVVLYPEWSYPCLTLRNDIEKDILSTNHLSASIRCIPCTGQADSHKKPQQVK